MFKNLKIKTKIAIIMALLVFINTLILGWISFSTSQKSLQDAVFAQLTSVKAAKKQAIEAYFSTMENQMVTLAEDKMIVNAMVDMKRAFLDFPIKDDSSDFIKSKQELMTHYTANVAPLVTENRGKSFDGATIFPNDSRTLFFQVAYISSNPNPVGSKNLYDRAPLDNEYNILHAVYQPVIRNFIAKFGFYDIFLVDDKTGYVIYTNFKNVDYATSLLTGPHSNSNIAKCFKASLNSSTQGSVALTDFESYIPSNDAPSAFISSPIYDGNEKVGVLILQIPIEKINNVMTGNKGWKNDGLGETGETYLVGDDYKMKSISRFLVENPEGYYQTLKDNGYNQGVIDIIKANKTSVMFQEIKTEATTDAIAGNADNKIIRNYRDIPVLSSYDPLNIKGVKWVIVSEKDEAEAFAAITKLRTTIIFVGLGVLVLSILISLFIAGSISKPILELVEKIKIVAGGDLTVNIESNSKDEVGQALASMKAMVDKLKSVISSVVSATNNITAASNEMSSSSQSMSEGASEQASSAEEVSSSMEQMVANIQQNTDNSKQTEKIAQKASADVAEGSKAVNQTVESMKTIAGKISIIGEIARQTNLLALNAAVEAARAGEHGKGFAVVAAEVRKLAERSEAAATEINAVSSSSVDIAQKSGQLLDKVVPDIVKTANLVQEISAASIEQNTGAEQINNAIQQLNNIVQQNAAAAEEIAATSEELSAQALHMKEQISFFKTGEDEQNMQQQSYTASSTKGKILKPEKTKLKISSGAHTEGKGVTIDLSDKKSKLDDDYQKF